MHVNVHAHVQESCARSPLQHGCKHAPRLQCCTTPHTIAFATATTTTLHTLSEVACHMCLSCSEQWQLPVPSSLRCTASPWHTPYCRICIPSQCSLVIIANLCSAGLGSFYFLYWYQACQISLRQVPTLLHRCTQRTRREVLCSLQALWQEDLCCNECHSAV